MFLAHYDITEADFDIYQHVNHVDGIRLLECARADYIKSLGFPLEAILARGLLLVVKELSAKYLREIKAGQIAVSCGNCRLDGKDLLITQKITNEKGKLAITADIRLACVDAKLRRAVDAPADFLAAFIDLS